MTGVWSILCSVRSSWPRDRGREGMARPKRGAGATVPAWSPRWSELGSLTSAAQSIQERRATAAAFDAVPVLGQHGSQLRRRFVGRRCSVVGSAQPNVTKVFSVGLDSPKFEQMASIRFWISADPVTTVEERSGALLCTLTGCRRLGSAGSLEAARPHEEECYDQRCTVPGSGLAVYNQHCSRQLQQPPEVGVRSGCYVVTSVNSQQRGYGLPLQVFLSHPHGG